MPTDNPKISGYVPQQIYDRFKEYQEENKLSMSQAVIVILSEYFGLEEIVKENISGSPVGGVTLSAFQDLVKRVEYLESTLQSTSENIDVEEEDTSTSVIIEEENISGLPLDLGVSYLESDIELDGKSFAKRLNINTSKLSTIRSEIKTTNEFTEWTTQNDPDQIAWNYKTKIHGKGVLYCPLENTDNELLSKLKKWIAKNIN